MNDFLTEEMKQELRKVFEPKYKRKLSDSELLEIADNLCVVVEELLKLKWRQKYEQSI